MKIESISIRNFKGLQAVELADLSHGVVIAGVNGTGKSCVYDAIRLLKSAYGGYQAPNEWHQFFGEYQLDLNRPDEVLKIFFDRSKAVEIEARFRLAPDEQRYISDNLEALTRGVILREHYGARNRLAAMGGGLGQGEFGIQLDARVKLLTSQIRDALASDIHGAKLFIGPNLDMQTSSAPLLGLVFATYAPDHIGIIDYHGANRQYQRERFNNVRVDIAEEGDRMAQSSLYNLQNKYSNVKSELASALIRDLIAEKAGEDGIETPSVIGTLRELFEQLIPGKHFDGPRPSKGGQLSFNVRLDNGKEHDIDDLSSGEKEIVYGYLRIRNVLPKNSIIMIDEPELHLNPRLISGLPRFYKEHLGRQLNNQIWMVTHSDAFLRDAFRDGGFSIFHLSAPKAETAENQATAVEVFDDIQRLIESLVGDFAAFLPQGKVVIFESTESASFDAKMTAELFPEFASAVNAVSGENRRNVEQLYAALDRVGAKLKWPVSIYAVTDKDDLTVEDNRGDRTGKRRVLIWDAYHIENYLLEPEFIKKVMSDFQSFSNIPEDVEAELRRCASETTTNLVEHELRVSIYGQMIKAINLTAKPGAPAADAIRDALVRSGEKIARIVDVDFSEVAVKKMEADIERRLRSALGTGRWKRDFRGREILRRFAGKFLPGLPYEAFRDGIVARMRDANFRPSGMKQVIDEILAD